jgi:hypothetical protein
MDTTVREAVEKFVASVQAMLDEHYTKTYSNVQSPIITATYGKRYVRIVSTGRTGTCRSVYCFIDQNGDVLKAASWKAPAKGVRGSVLAENPLAGVTIYGAAYRR